ncbi:MAG: FAD synthase [Thaumarchaeota archaeon]|nr:FAD synthase [Nitrososphaerota archaeon]
MKGKQILSVIFSLSLLGGSPTLIEVGKRLGVEAADIREKVQECLARGLIVNRHGKLALTKDGRRALRVVFIGGGFEIIHQGHLYTIEKAKELGDLLVVVVAKDSTIRKRKKRDPVAGEEKRVALLSSLRQVDAAILGVEGNIYDTLEKVKPDVVALGYDQHHLESDIAREGKKRGLKLKVVRLDSPIPDVKTSAMLRDF